MAEKSFLQDPSHDSATVSATVDRMNPSKLTLWAALVLITSPIEAASPAPDDVRALNQVVNAYEAAIRSGDVSKSGIRQSLASGFTAVMPSGQLIGSYGELSKAENALRTLVGRGARYDTTEVVVDPVMEVSGDLAVFTGRTLNRATAQAGKSLAFTTHWSAVAKKENGAWRLLRHQAVMDPSTNPWNHDQSTGTRWGLAMTAGLIGGLLGAVIGFAAARLLGNRRSSSPRPAPSTSAHTEPPAVRTRAWEKGAPKGSATEPPPTQPTDPDVDPPAPEPDDSTPPPAARSGKKRAWEN